MKVLDMTTGDPKRLMLRFAVPLFIGNAFQQVYGIVDTMVAGYNLGDAAIAALGATTSFAALLIDFVYGINSGYAAVVSQSFGEKNQARLKEAVAGAFKLNIVVTAIITFFALVFMRPLMELVNTPSEIFDQAYEYFFIICAGLIATSMYHMFAALLRAVGNSKTTLYILVIAAVVNTVLDLVFVVGFKTGIAGAALATVIAQLASAIMSGIYAFKNYRELLPKKGEGRVSAEMYKTLLGQGFSMALMMVVINMGSIIFQRANNGLGTAYITASMANRRIYGVFSLILGTISMACFTFVGQNFGAKKFDRIRLAIKQALIMEVAAGVACFLLMLAIGRFAVELTTGSSDPLMLDNAQLCILWHFGLFPFLGVLLVFRNAMQAMGQKIIPVASGIIELVIKIISALVIIPALGFFGTCITEPVSWFIMAVFLVVVYRIKRW